MRDIKGTLDEWQEAFGDAGKKIVRLFRPAMELLDFLMRLRLEMEGVFRRGRAPAPDNATAE